MPQQASRGKVKFQEATNIFMQCQTLLTLHALFLSSSSQAQEQIKLQKLHKQQLD